MKKLLALALSLALMVSLASCTNSGSAEIALITDVGTIDDRSFNQGAWEGTKEYAKEHKISHKYYKPSEKSKTAYIESIELAIKGGAKVIVCPGFLFEEAVFEAQTTHPETKFILLDGTPNKEYKEFKVADNTVSVFYAEEQAGFLAGYAAVKDGYRKLGFMGGMAVPAVIRFGYGFVQGAEYAAKELKLGDNSLDIKYHYTGGFDATPEAQTLAATWYQSGTEVIFACGGAVGNSVMAAAKQKNGKVIGVDVDQSGESDTVITSAMKGLGTSVYSVLKDNYDNKFPGGKTLVLNAANDGVGLPMKTSKFKTFKQADYDAIFNKLVNDTDKLASSLIKDQDANKKEVKVTDIPVKAVKLTEIK